MTAHSAVPSDYQIANYEIRNCEDLDDLRACVALQKGVWGFTDIEVVPLRMFVVAQKIGGQVIGAFRDGELIAFALALPGVRGGHPYLHSQMLAVRKEHRNAGLGRRIKLFQRDDALLRGIELIEWTFDPLEIKNAYLNIKKLGAIARRYTVNQYGITSSPLQGGMPTDRLIAEWWLKSKRVQNLLTMGSLPVHKPVKTISLPAEIYKWKDDPASRYKAKAVQDKNRDIFLKAFKDGLAVLDFERDAEGNGTFLLSSWNENWSYTSQ
ncbi:MAG TPA: GNAT family N-acetyltransferase [Terriglobales bacterium]|nr:GNAT family N-acetyltransferase [Terriglobales bacterium]